MPSFKEVIIQAIEKNMAEDFALPTEVVIGYIIFLIIWFISFLAIFKKE